MPLPASWVKEGRGPTMAAILMMSAECWEQEFSWSGVSWFRKDWGVTETLGPEVPIGVNEKDKPHVCLLIPPSEGCKW